MLDRTNQLKGYALHGIDGDIGKVEDFLFDDRYWTIRYLVADAGSWLASRQVLLSPYALTSVNRVPQTISIELTKQSIKDSPPLSSDEPVSRQYEEAYYTYYQWPMYFGGGNMWGTYPYIARDREEWSTLDADAKRWDAHLRSTDAVLGSHVHASDGEIGHVQDFILDDETWAIRYLVIDTRNWWPGKRVLVSPQWIDSVNWPESLVMTLLTRDQIKDAPEYVEGTSITRDYEARLHQHYMKPDYWTDHALAAAKA